MTSKHRTADFFWPLAAVAFVAMALLVSAAFALLHQFDVSDMREEQTVVSNGVVGRIAEVAHMVVPTANWDDAVRHLANRYDGDWVRKNVIADLHQTDGFESTVVLDPDDHPLLAADQGVLVDPAQYRGMVARGRPLVGAVRRAEARRGPDSALLRTGKILADPIQQSTIALIDSRLFILTATLVQPDFGTAMPQGLRTPIILTGMPIDQPFLGALAKRFLLRNIHVRLGDATSEPGDAHAALTGEDGKVVATIDWTPKRPGSALLHRLVLPILIVVAVLGAFALLLYRRSRRMAQNMIASEARAAHLAYYDALTGLPNRVLYFDRLGHALQQMRRSSAGVAVHCIDLDRFKDVNDTFGHHVGDELIQEAARRLSAQCRKATDHAGQREREVPIEGD